MSEAADAETDARTGFAPVATEVRTNFALLVQEQERIIELLTRHVEDCGPGGAESCGLAFFHDRQGNP